MNDVKNTVFSVWKKEKISTWKGSSRTLSRLFPMRYAAVSVRNAELSEDNVDISLQLRVGVQIVLDVLHTVDNR